MTVRVQVNQKNQQHRSDGDSQQPAHGPGEWDPWQKQKSSMFSRGNLLKQDIRKRSMCMGVSGDKLCWKWHWAMSSSQTCPRFCIPLGQVCPCIQKHFLTVLCTQKQTYMLSVFLHIHPWFLLHVFKMCGSITDIEQFFDLPGCVHHASTEADPTIARCLRSLLYRCTCAFSHWCDLRTLLLTSQHMAGDGTNL